MGYKPPRHEQLNGHWRKYYCKQCTNPYEVFTIAPLPRDAQVCFLCQKQYTTIKAYANAVGAII